MRCCIVRVLVIAGLCALQISCTRGKQAPAIKNKVPLTKVTGVIKLDGAEKGGVMVSYRPTGDIEEKRDMFLAGFYVRSMRDGQFALKTYEQADGVPAGQYALCCEYFPMQETGLPASEDMLGGKYNDFKKPVKTFEVKSGETLDLGTIELKSAPSKKN